MDSNPNRGMERGFALSPMARLLTQYLGEDSEDVQSTFEGVKWIISKSELQINDILDRGIDVNRPTRPRFCLRPETLKRVLRITGELQSFLKSAASLIQGRSTHFQVDPENACIPILEGAFDLAQMNGCWKLLRRRVELGDIRFNKYQNEYQDGTDLLSPLSTAADLYEPLQSMDDADDKLRYLYSRIPRHRETLSAVQQQHVDEHGPWNSIVRPSDSVTEAFPLRSPREHPFELYYTDQGVRTQEIPLPPRRSDAHVTKRKERSQSRSRLGNFGLSLPPEQPRDSSEGELAGMPGNFHTLGTTATSANVALTPEQGDRYNVSAFPVEVIPYKSEGAFFSNPDYKHPASRFGLSTHRTPGTPRSPGLFVDDPDVSADRSEVFRNTFPKGSMFSRDSISGGFLQQVEASSTTIREASPMGDFPFPVGYRSSLAPHIEQSEPPTAASAASAGMPHAPLSPPTDLRSRLTGADPQGATGWTAVEAQREVKDRLVHKEAQGRLDHRAETAIVVHQGLRARRDIMEEAPEEIPTDRQGHLVLKVVKDHEEAEARQDHQAMMDPQDRLETTDRRGPQDREVRTASGIQEAQDHLAPRGHRLGKRSQTRFTKERTAYSSIKGWRTRQ
ncbi:hypothetical protein C8R46DRAFT_1043216 [Mycena filopes]|nr:hypothetical protein C8R46DRAFT_1043216 [Mycena filopes]